LGFYPITTQGWRLRNGDFSSSIDPHQLTRYESNAAQDCSILNASKVIM
jgi:hypothetical protein